MRHAPGLAIHTVKQCYVLTIGSYVTFLRYVADNEPPLSIYAIKRRLDACAGWRRGAEWLTEAAEAAITTWHTSSGKALVAAEAMSAATVAAKATPGSAGFLECFSLFGCDHALFDRLVDGK